MKMLIIIACLFSSLVFANDTVIDLSDSDQQRRVADLITTMWEEGHRWNDREFFELAKEASDVAFPRQVVDRAFESKRSAPTYLQEQILKILGKKESVTSDRSHKVLRWIVDNLNLNYDLAWFNKWLLQEVLFKEHWLKSKVGFEMLVEITRRGHRGYNELMGQALPKLWKAGYRWSDKKFADFVLWVATHDLHCADPMFDILSKKGAPKHRAARRALEIIVSDDYLLFSVPEKFERLMEKVLNQKQWLRSEVGFNVVVDLYHKVPMHRRMLIRPTLTKMWIAGYRWSDKKYADFVKEVAKRDPYNNESMVRATRESKKGMMKLKANKTCRDLIAPFLL